jgi:hypothetical protein
MTRAHTNKSDGTLACVCLFDQKCPNLLKHVAMVMKGQRSGCAACVDREVSIFDLERYGSATSLGLDQIFCHSRAKPFELF